MLLTSSSYSVTTILAAILTAVSVASLAYNWITLYLARRKFKLENGCLPLEHYVPTKDPIFGSDQVRKRLKAFNEHIALEMAVENYEKYGYTFSNHAMGRSFISTIEPQNIKTILSLRFKDFGIGNREKTLGRLLGRGIFTTDGEPWVHSRAMIRPNFTRDQVADLTSFERHVKALVKLIPRDGSTVDLQELFFRLTIDSATEFLFGQSTNSLRVSQNSDSSEINFAREFNLAQNAVAVRGRLGFMGWFSSDARGDDAIRACHEFVDQFVDEAVRYREKFDLESNGEKAREEKYVFLHELAKATKDKRRLRDELLNVLLAGRDTTASLLSNMWFVLAKRPDIYAKLRTEVEETLHGGHPTYEQLRNMKYLKYCLNESLRLHPVVPGNSRMAHKDSVLPLGGGPDGKSPIFVPKGTVVIYTPYAMHRRKDFFGPDADEFRPERWEALRPGWEYLPFNGGPRICLGQQYALTEAGYVTVRLLQEFKNLESRDPEPWYENLTLTMCSHNGTKVSLTPV